MSAVYYSLGSLLGELRSTFPPSLIGDPGWDRLSALTRRLPFCVTDERFGFEFDLSDPRPMADFFVVAAPETCLAEFYLHQAANADPSLIGTDFTAFLAEQSRTTPASFLARMNKGIILEYDLARADPGVFGIPGIFISTRDSLEPSPEDLHEDPDALAAALRSAAGWEPDTAETRQIRQVCAALAASGIGVAHAGVMPGRAERAVRLVARGAGAAGIPGALEQAGWEGDLSRVDAVLSDFTGLVNPRVGIDLDIDKSGVLPRLGLEFFRMIEGPGWEEYFRPDPAGWRPSIDRLEENNWCLSAKAEGLREWPRLELFFGRDGVYHIRRIINHLKVVIDPHAIFAKAYTGMDVRRVTP